MFKGIVDLSFPHFVKYLFWGSQHNKGFFTDPEQPVKSDENINMIISEEAQPLQEENSSADLEFEGQNIFTEEQYSYDTSK